MYAELPRHHVADALRSVASQYAPRLVGSDPEALRRRPSPEVWSPLEYAVHVRDVLAIQHERVVTALVHDTPAFASMRPEERVVVDCYNAQDPLVVASDIAGRADALAALLESLTPREWARVGVYNWPQPTTRDVEWIGRHTVHEEVHHLRGMARSLQGPPGTPDGLGSG